MNLQEMEKEPDYFVTCRRKIYCFVEMQAGDWRGWGQKERSVARGTRDWVRRTWVGQT